MVLGIDASRAVGLRTGVGRDLQHLLAAWSRQKLPFELVRVFTPAPIPDVPGSGPFRLEILPSRSAGLVWQVCHLRRAAADVDVLFAPYTLPFGYRGRSVVNNLGIYEGRFAIHGWRARLHSWQMSRSARRATVVIANSESTKADVVRFYSVPAERVVVIWPGVAGYFRPLRPGEEEEVERAAERLLGERAPYFLFVGKLSARRNVPALLEAFALFHPAHPEYRLLLLGPNTTGLPLPSLFARLGLTDAVRHIEHVDHETVALLYRGAHAFVLPTEHEGFSFTIPEALASGCPVITVRHAALVEAGLDQASIAVPDSSPESLAGALERIVEDESLHAELRRRGPEAARALSWDETARKTMGVLAAVAKGER